MRLLHFCALVLLVLAAAYVYEIKFESTLRAERVAKMRGDVQRERDAIAALRAEWATLDNPARIQGLARRHLKLRPADATQFDPLDRLPERPPVVVQPPPADAIAVDDRELRNRRDRQRAGQADETTRSDRRTMDAQMHADTPVHDEVSAERRAQPRAEPWRRRMLRHAALRPQCRSHRQGARPRRARDPRLRRGLCRHRRAAGHVRGGAGKPFRAARRGARMRSRPRAPTSSTATA